MPDISKIPELCKILNISFEELVGERIPETDTVEKMLQDEKADVSLEEMAQIGQLVKPDKIESKVNETVEKGKKIPFSVLVRLAPFMDMDNLGKLAEELADIDLGKLCAIAPFLKVETLDVIIDKAIQNNEVDVHKIVSIAPFLSTSTIQKIAEYLIEHGQADKLVVIAPFMGKEMLSSQLKDIRFDMSSKNEGKSCSIHSELIDLDEEDAAKIAIEALKQGKDVGEYLDYMDEDDVAKLAEKALELDRCTEVFLDYMNEDDVEKLAYKALEAGKTIECYLDYMNEDAIKKMLLMSVKR